MTLALASVLPLATAGDITGTVTLHGTPPPESVNDAIAHDSVCGKLHPGVVWTKFFVLGDRNGLKDVVVKLADLGGKSTGASASPLLLAQTNCEYVPYISAVQTGQKILVRNSDPLLHNVHPAPESPGNAEKNVPQAAGGPDLVFVFSTPENFLRFKCDVHPWMFAYVTVVDHPYFAVTDKDGRFKIANVPPGHYTVEAMHRKAGKAHREISVDAGASTLDFELEAPKVR